MNIGDRIKRRREDLSISAEELGRRIGKAKTTVYRYESGAIENMPSTVVEPIAKALLTSPAYLMGWTDNADEGTEAVKASSEIENELISVSRKMTIQEKIKLLNYAYSIINKGGN